MKKSIKIISCLALLAFAAISCSKMNELPRFDDKDAYVAFSSASLSVNETAGTISIPVTLVSLNGFTTSVSINAIDGTAKSGVNYKVTTTSLNFTPTAPKQNVEVQIINQPGVFTGDLTFTLELGNPGAVNLGAAKSIRVTIADLDHPLAAILGTWTATGQSYFEDDGVLQDWSVTILKDSKDLSKVWFVNLVPYVSGTPVNPFGIVNSDMTEIRIPVHQVLATSGSYGLIRLESYYGPDGEEYIEDGGFITITIAPNKKSMVIQDELLAAVYRNADATGLLGYFEAIASGTIMKKD